VSFVAITLCVASQRVIVVVVYFVMTQSGNLWIHPLCARRGLKVPGLILFASLTPLYSQFTEKGHLRCTPLEQLCA
jgi:hypothetical protein